VKEHLKDKNFLVTFESILHDFIALFTGGIEPVGVLVGMGLF